ncbi:hypothetical protein KL86PLE_90239 [uncultured Pleomorphomonas sp.]|uniref:Uncharacterized protein n=1 Tax=uncultured Pleomorphomonas sp. TaxID=442121 RepID=A0A212LNM5_9HYPH|nr:hypothetical protein KL86PLE_90239 [uncultured Pleomorphomonas sp.]
MISASCLAAVDFPAPGQPTIRTRFISVPSLEQSFRAGRHDQAWSHNPVGYLGVLLTNACEAMLSVEGDRGHADAENPDFDPRRRLDTKRAPTKKTGADSSSLPVRTHI